LSDDTDTSIFTLLLYCSVHLVYSDTQGLLHMCNKTEDQYRCREEQHVLHLQCKKKNNLSPNFKLTYYV